MQDRAAEMDLLDDMLVAQIGQGCLEQRLQNIDSEMFMVYPMCLRLKERVEIMVKHEPTLR